MSRAVLYAFFLLVVGCSDPVPDLCVDVDCSGRGTCVSEGQTVYCECNQGFVAQGLTCIADQEERAVCESEAVVVTTHEDFLYGNSNGTAAFPRSAASNLYVAYDGSLRSIRSTDLNNDGLVDLVFVSFANWPRGTTGDFTVDSFVYYGLTPESFATPAQQFDTTGAGAWQVADLNLDGYQELLLGNHWAGIFAIIDETSVFWGTEEGPDPDDVMELDSEGAHGVAVADLDRNGYLDIVISGARTLNSFDTQTFVYFGEEEGYSNSNRLDLDTPCGMGVAIADMDGDDHLDLIVTTCVVNNQAISECPIFWGPDFESATILPGADSHGLAIADLDEDGALDVVISNHSNNWVSGYSRNSYIYWGPGPDSGLSPRDYSVERRTELPTIGADGVSVGDLDSDGALDVFFANRDSGFGRMANNSYIYWGPDSEDRRDYHDKRRSLVPATGASGVWIQHINHDPYPDIVLANGYSVDDEFGPNESYLYWGRSPMQAREEFTEDHRLRLSTIGCHRGNDMGLGNTYTRQPFETYLSPPIEIPTDQRVTHVHWPVTTVTDVAGDEVTAVRFQFKAAESAEGLELTAWQGPTGSDDWYEQPTEITFDATARFVQFRAQFNLGNHTDVVVLDWVTFCTVSDQ